MQDSEVIDEFKVEADEMLNDSEEYLLNLGKGQDFEQNFNGVFRAFHSLKGAAGMFEINELQSFMHRIETQLDSLREVGSFSPSQVDYFLLAIDCARPLLEGQHSIFDYDLFDQLEKKDEKLEPLIKAEEQKESVLARKEKNLNKKKGRVIVIDDEAFICEELCGMLNEFGFNASSFTNPVEALAEIIKEKPDLICTDLKMPEMSGMELLKKVRGLKIECPVIFITGFIDNGLLTEGLDQGASGFLEKPFEQHEVVSLAIQSVERFRTRKLLNRSINYIIYQFNDLDNYLKKEGKESLRKSFKLEIETLLTLRRESNS